MELRHVRTTGTTSQEGNCLQRETAMRVQARIDAEMARKRSIERMQRLKSFLSLLFFVAVGVFCFLMWKSGRFDECLGKFGSRGGASASQYDAEDKPTEVSDASTKPTLVETVQSVLPGAKKKDDVTVGLEDNIDLCNEAESMFAGATLDYWKNAVEADKPAKGKPPLVFVGAVPDGKGGRMLFELTLAHGKPLAVKRLSAAHGATSMTKAEFERQVAGKPYLVVREGRAYYCSAVDGGQERDSYPVPSKGKTLNPSRDEYGPLLVQLDELKVKKPSTRYEIILSLDKFKKKLPVAEIGFGEDVARASFEKVARTLVDDVEACETLLSSGKVLVHRK